MVDPLPLSFNEADTFNSVQYWFFQSQNRVFVRKENAWWWGKLTGEMKEACTKLMAGVVEGVELTDES